jgi:adenylate cyclase
MAEADRKLTTIFAADAVGYSRMMSADEAATLTTLKDHHAAMERLIAANGGRVFNTAGDGLMAEFQSVVKAVECAIAVQREVAERNAPLPPDKRMWFRIGINLGDVMVDQGNLFGDGVNVAARLQALADPGGVLVSGPVHDLVRDKLSVSFGYLGQKSVKNIPNDVAVYQVLLQTSGTIAAAPSAVPPSRTNGNISHHPLAFSAIRTLALIALVFAINLFTRGDNAGSGGWWFKRPSLGFIVWFGLEALSYLRKRMRS